MTTRNELMDLAKANPRPGTPELITAINEARDQMNLAAFNLHSRSQRAKDAIAERSYQDVGGVTADAIAYDCAAAKLNTLFMTLACILQNSGVEVNY